MGTKLGAAVVSVIAALFLFAPVASASTPASATSSVSSVSTSGSSASTNNRCVAQRNANNSTRSVGRCSNIGQNNGRGNTLNGQPVSNPFRGLFGR